MVAIWRRNQEYALRDIPRLWANWDFSDPTTLGTTGMGTPGTVLDKSGNGRTLTAGGSNTSPLSIRKSPTGLTAIDGATAATGLGYSSSLSNPLSSGDVLVSYTAMYPSAVGGGNRVFANNTTGGNWLLGPYSNNWAMFDGAGFIGSPGAYPVGSWVVHTGVVSASQTLTAHWGDGVLLGSAARASGYPGDGPGIGLSFGENPRVFLGEVVVCQYYDETVRKKIEAYLSRKWGTTSALAMGVGGQVRPWRFIGSAATSTIVRRRTLGQRTGTRAA